MPGESNMGTSNHAILSASSSHRWLNCPPSARLSISFEEAVSSFAAEGTDAHALCEYKLLLALGLINDDAPPVLEWFNEVMEDCANSYVAYVLEIIEDIKMKHFDPLVMIEQKLDYSKYCENGYGTGDCVIASDGILHVVDFKYGQGIQVDAHENTQMMLYALGAIEMIDSLYDIEDIYMTIYQPRRANISTYHMKKSALYEWVEKVLIPTAKLAHDGTGEFKAGDWCQFCKVKTTCRARANYNIELAKLEFAQPPLLTDEEIEEVLSKIDGLVEWANDIKAYALESAIKGKKWTGWKLVEGRSIRKYTDESAVAEVVTDAGYDPFEKKLLGITEMQKRIGKTKFDELLSSLLIKPLGKPTLVLESDKRPEFNAAKADFMTNTEE